MYLYINCLIHVREESISSGQPDLLPCFLLDTDMAFNMLLEIIQWPAPAILCVKGMEILAVTLSASNVHQKERILSVRELDGLLLGLIDSGEESVCEVA